MSLSYQVIYSKRKTLGIFVERDKSIVVRVPEGTPKHTVDEVVNQKKAWIYDKLGHQQKYHRISDSKEFISGEYLMYLGENYQLKVTPKKFDGVVFDNDFIISVHNKPKAKEIFKSWFKSIGIKVISNKVDYYATHLGVKYKSIKLSEMKYRWGSCTVAGVLTFNWRIIKAPVFVIDYIIVHELAHLIHLNHSNDFWNTVAIQQPNFEKAKNWLKENGKILEADF
ncbi:MAG: M48 family metallopeptidase [Spirosomaceae bacterium]|jgi:hypothetical protein|nr:M48 family metallopeptidase [Spirosomataceae bacterium]MCU0469596.1 M48 family metallopeptidase [Arcicella sp.]